MARVEDGPSEEEDEPEVIIEDDATEQEEDNDNETEASDDLSDGEEENVLEAKISELEGQLGVDPYQYDLHIQVVNNYNKLADLERLRNAIERLHSLYPLRPDHWLLWAQTEALMPDSMEHRVVMYNMYERATNHVYYIPIYARWLMYALRFGIVDIRKHYEVILRRVGYDPSPAAAELWRDVIEFEKNHVEDLSIARDDLKDPVVRLAHWLAEQLRRPLLETAGVADELRQLEASHKSLLPAGYVDKVLADHIALKDMREKIRSFEERLIVAELDSKVDIYKQYLDEMKQLHSAMLQLVEEPPFNFLEWTAALYDRATFDSLACIRSAELFSQYGRFASQLPAEEQARVYEVCVARRPLVAEHWLQLMQYLERQQRPFEEIQSTLERAFGGPQQMPQCEGEEVWLGYLESLRRYTFASEQPDAEKLRSNFRYVLTTMQTMYGEETDTTYTILLWWARLEYRRLGDPARGRAIFEENIFHNSFNKSLSNFWLELIELETGRSPRPADKKLRELHRRSVKFTTDYPPSVCNQWIAFERDYGTIDSLIQCKDVCKETLEQWRLTREASREAKPNAKKPKGKKKKQQNENTDEKTNADKSNGDSKSKGRKRAAEGGSETEDAKKRKEEGEVRQNGAKRSHDAEDEAVERKRKRLPEGDAAIMPPPEAPKAASTEAPAATEKTEKDKEACTLFVSNLDFKFDESALRRMLSQWGTVAALRFVRGVKAFGGSICYCEYTTPEAVDAAIAHDRTPLEGRPLFLSRYRADRQKGKFKYATVTERNKLFVKNLPFTCCTREKLREVFEPHGALVDVRIVSYKDGRPKGLAYVEYADEKSAATALQKTDGLLLEERNIQVAYSAPPARDIPTPASLGQARRDTNAPRRTQLGGFVPRVLQKPTAATNAPSTSASTSASTSKSMSNSDFRNMLLNKK